MREVCDLTHVNIIEACHQFNMTNVINKKFNIKELIQVLIFRKLARLHL